MSGKKNLDNSTVKARILRLGKKTTQYGEGVGWGGGVREWRRRLKTLEMSAGSRGENRSVASFYGHRSQWSINYSPCTPSGF